MAISPNDFSLWARLTGNKYPSTPAERAKKGPEVQNFIQNLDKNARLLFADVNSKNRLETYRLKSSKFLSVLIGPEGDFSSNERQNILSNPQTIPFTLSNNILRSETAVISALSLINHSII